MSLRVTVILIVLSLICIPVFAQEESSTPAIGEEESSSDLGILVRGGVGLGTAAVGIVETKYSATDPTDTSAEAFVGSASGIGINIAGMINYSVLAFELEMLYSTIGELTIEKTEYGWDGSEMEVEETWKGSGSYFCLDPKFGLKLFTEEGDMGYTFLYAGLRIWNGKYTTQEVDRTEEGGSTVNFKVDDDYGNSMGGTGWIAGIHDYSTIPVSSFAIVINWGILVDSAPAKEVESYDGYGKTTTTKFDESEGLGVGFDFGLGVALEDQGLSFLINYKVDVVATIGKKTESIMGQDVDLYSGGAFGVGQYYFTVTKQF